MERVPFSQIPQPVQATQPIGIVDANIPVLYEGMPLDLVRHFAVDVKQMTEGDKKQINDIYNWVKGSLAEQTPGNVMLAIRQISNRLGSPQLGETRFGKMWNYLRIQQSIDDLSKQRKAMEYGSI